MSEIDEEQVDEEQVDEEQLETLEKINKNLGKLIEQGLIDYCGEDENGQELYKITEKGKKAVEAMPSIYQSSKNMPEKVEK